eukprot:11933456-Heterocapsa_arctica.AAC.1
MGSSCWVAASSEPSMLPEGSLTAGLALSVLTTSASLGSVASWTWDLSSGAPGWRAAWRA